MGLEFRSAGRRECRKGSYMIRIREISLPPEHSVHQLPYEAAQMLRVSNSKIRGFTIVRRSIDARKKPEIRVIYTVDVTVDGSEKRILRGSGCKFRWWQMKRAFWVSMALVFM